MPGFEVIPYNDLGALKVGLRLVTACPVQALSVREAPQQ